MKISERIKKYREENHITQQELADKLYVSKQAISKWENDKSLPDVSMYPTIASLLNITVDELMGNEANKNKLILSKKYNKKRCSSCFTFNIFLGISYLSFNRFVCSFNLY